LFLRAETNKNMEMWFRAIQMHADLARGGNGFTILSNSTTISPSKNRAKKHTSIFDQLDKATKALTELERTVDMGSEASNSRDIGISIEPDLESTRYQLDDEVKEDPFDGHSNSKNLLYQPKTNTRPVVSSQPQPRSQSKQPQHQQQRVLRHDDSLEDSTESLENIVPVPIRKPATQHRQQTQQQPGGFGGFHVSGGVSEERETSGRSGGSSSNGSGGGHAWA
jgi:hypothetical protein